MLDPGDEIVCGWPSFPSYVIYAAKQGARPVTVPLVEHRYDLDALLDAVTPRTKLLYVCQPNNPTGTMNTRAELDAILRARARARPRRRRPGVLRVHRRPGLPRRDRRVPEGGPPRRRVADVLEDLRPRRPPCRLCGRSAPLHRGDGKGAAAVRRHDDGSGRGARQPRRRSRDRAAPAPSTPRASRGSTRRCASTGSMPFPPSATSSSSETGERRTALFDALLREGVIVRPLRGFGAPTADPRVRRDT